MVADADAPFAAQIHAALSDKPGITVVGRASSGDEAIELTMSESPDVAFVALDMPGGFEAAQHILTLVPRPPRVILMASGDFEADVSGYGAGMSGTPGISGFVRKTDDADEIVALVAALAVLAAPVPTLTNGH